MTIDNRHKLLPAFEQVVREGEKDWNTGCETNTEIHLAHAGAPIDAGWQPGQAYSYSRAYTEYFDNQEKALGKDLERTLRSTLKWGMMREKDWSTTIDHRWVRPPVLAIAGSKPVSTQPGAEILFPLKSYQVMNGWETPSDKLFSFINDMLASGHVLGAYLQLSEAVYKIGKDGIMPNQDTSRNLQHVVPLWGKVEKKGNDDWYGFRNHAGTGWGDHGDFYVHRSYLVRHKNKCRFYLANFQ